MLNDYIELYRKAVKDNDKAKMTKIEKDLAYLGMDKMTLRELIKEDTVNERLAQQA
jgi:Cu/Ag efflux protein CusF